jgi:hypothetical protein
MSTIKISELNTFPALLKTEDFFPIDRSSSLLTYRATLGQLQTLLSTGSFSGSLIGTSSWANNSISSSYAITSSYSSNTISASYALTASYVSGSGGGVTGNGTVNYLPIWTGTTVLGNSNIYYTASLGYVSSYKNIAIENGQAFFIARGTYNCGYTMQSMYTASDAWSFGCGTENTGTSRGIFELVTYSGSNQLISKQSNDPDGYGIIRALRTVSNGFYFWPLGGAQTVSRDGTFNIGVDSGTANTETRFMIHVYSGSSVSNPQTYHIQKAIEVRYGSSSLDTTFCVSSSGYVYSTGYNVISSSNYAYTSSLVSGSFAVIEDNGVMYLFARSANGKLRSASLA